VSIRHGRRSSLGREAMTSGTRGSFAIFPRREVGSGAPPRRASSSGGSHRAAGIPSVAAAMAARSPSRDPFAAMTDGPKGDAHELLDPSDDFARRHLGADSHDIAVMLGQIGVGSLEELIDQTIPAEIRNPEPLRLSGLAEPLGESAALERLRGHASRN